MQRILLIFNLVLFYHFANSQNSLVINELDCDTPGIDDKEFVELRSFEPNFPLDGYILVFFNGSVSGGNRSYLTLDLEGYTTDINGIFLIGSTTVSPFPQYIIPANVIQNGADAVAIYRSAVENFPSGTLAYVDSTLIDVLIYGTNDPDAVTMIEIFKLFDPNIKQINEGSANNTNSIQRNNDGTYFVSIPTPRKMNDGSGIELNGLFSGFTSTEYNEGDSFEIVFTTEQNVDEALVIEFSLENGSFDSTDYTGDTRIIIPIGQKTASTTITIIDDDKDEGDEVMLFRLHSLPPEILPFNNNVEIRIVDNDFKGADFGTPVQPTYGRVSGTQSNDYYDGLSGLNGEELTAELQNIISNPDIVRTQTYNDLIDLLQEADQNPENSNQVWLVYLEKGRAKLDFQTTSNNLNKWNREHTWPRSRGGFFSIEDDNIIDGKEIYWITNADSIRHGNSDAHAIRVSDGVENSKRGNQYYGQYNGPSGNSGSFKGDVARGVFYLAIRYNGLEVVQGFPEGQIGKFGDLTTLLNWHRNDPPDDFEMNRNNIVFEWQKNRNPFIDIPELIEYIWGNKSGEAWQIPSTTIDKHKLRYKIFPNPAKQTIQIEGIESETILELIDIHGIIRLKKELNQNTSLDLLFPTGLYFIKLSSGGVSFVDKLWIE